MGIFNFEEVSCKCIFSSVQTIVVTGIYIGDPFPADIYLFRVNNRSDSTM